MSKNSLGLAGKLAQAFINSKLTPLIVAPSILLGIGAVVLLPRKKSRRSSYP